MVRPITTFDWIPYQIFANGRRQRPADGPGPSPRPARLLSSRDSCWPWIAARPVAAETAPPPARRLLLARQLIFSGRRTTPYAMRGNAGVPSAAAFGKRFGGGFRAVTHRSRERHSNPMTPWGVSFWEIAPADLPLRDPRADNFFAAQFFKPYSRQARRRRTAARATRHT
jgi:hypothetical protein